MSGAKEAVENTASDAKETVENTTSDAKETVENTTQEATGATESEGGSWFEKPEGFGNSAGEKVQSVLSPVANTVGKPLETVGKPLGGVIDPLVGGLMRSGEAFGDTVGVGFGNKDGGPAKQQEAEAKRMKEPVGGKEQTGDNPLGL